MTASRAARPLAALAAFLALADTGVVALALPPILRELDTTVAGVASVLAVYAVVLAVALLPAERLVRARGASAVGACGAVLFAAASAGCGLAESLPLLLALRALQAVGGAAVLVAAFAVLRGRDGRRWWSLAVLLGTAAGPALGGALTQAFGWRSIFLVQAPIALAAALAWLASREPAPLPAERPGVTAMGGTPGRSVPGAVALVLVSGALASALFLTVLLLVTGWALEPIAGAAVISTVPLAALVGERLRADPAVRAAGGGLLVAAGTACLAFLPGASVAWTIGPQVLVGLGMGLAVPALAGGLLHERDTRDAASLLTLRHAGIALALIVLAPVAQHDVDDTIERTRERGAALILDARLSPSDKLALAPVLTTAVETEQPRTGLERVFDDRRDEIGAEGRGEYENLENRADQVLVTGVNDGFRTSFLIGAAFALLAAGAAGIALAPRWRTVAAAAAAAAIATPAVFAAAADTRRPDEVVIRDPCEDRELPNTGGLEGFAQDTALNALDSLACRAGSSREELVLALVDDGARRDYERRHGVDPRSVTDVLGLVFGN